MINLFNNNLVTVELLCKAKGDDICTFVMTHPKKIEETIEKMKKINTSISNITISNYLNSTNEYKFYKNNYSSKNIKGGIIIFWFFIFNIIEIYSFNDNLIIDIFDPININKNKEYYQKQKRLFKKKSNFFGQLLCDPRNASVTFETKEQEKYIFIRPKSLSVGFFSIVNKILENNKQEVRRKKKVILLIYF